MKDRWSIIIDHRPITTPCHGCQSTTAEVWTGQEEERNSSSPPSFMVSAGEATWGVPAQWTDTGDGPCWRACDDCQPSQFSWAAAGLSTATEELSPVTSSEAAETGGFPGSTGQQMGDQPEDIKRYPDALSEATIILSPHRSSAGQRLDDPPRATEVSPATCSGAAVTDSSPGSTGQQSGSLATSHPKGHEPDTPSEAVKVIGSPSSAGQPLDNSQKAAERAKSDHSPDIVVIDEEDSSKRRVDCGVTGPTAKSSARSPEPVTVTPGKKRPSMPTSRTPILQMLEEVFPTKQLAKPPKTPPCRVSLERLTVRTTSYDLRADGSLVLWGLRKTPSPYTTSPELLQCGAQNDTGDTGTGSAEDDEAAGRQLQVS